MWRSLGHFLFRLCLPVPVVEPEGEPLIESGNSSDEEAVEDHRLVPAVPAQILTFIQLNTQSFQIRQGILPTPGHLRSEEIRWYAVWAIPSDPGRQLSGIHWGVSTTAYSGLLSLNGNQFEGIRFRRFRGREEARIALLEEAWNFNLTTAVADRLFCWEYAEGGPERLPVA